MKERIFDILVGILALSIAIYLFPSNSRDKALEVILWAIAIGWGAHFVIVIIKRFL